MADEQIVNTLGFNVEDALGALGRLDAALQTSGKAFGTYAEALDGFNDRAEAALKRMRSLATAVGNLSTAMQNMPAAGAAPATPAQPQLWLPPGIERPITPKIDTKPIEDADRKTKDFTISWQTLGRVVLTQLIVRAMSQIRDALHEAVTESIEFQQHIAEIQTIAPQLGGAFTSLTSEAAEFAKQYNIPLNQAAAGLYETISNQFEGMSERANIMTAAVKLSRTTLMDFNDAVLLITGTLNAYGMTSAQSESVASKFFTTIKLGRVHGKELAATMGQVIPIASELGISLDEVNSALVALTIGGLDAHKSVTAMRSAMTAFLKPSEEMKKAVREMGFTSPEQLVQAKTWQGALVAIAEAADGMGDKIAKSIPNVRGLIAEFRLSKEGAKQVAEAMKAMETSTPAALDKIFKQFTSTDAEKLTSQVNKLKIDLTQDLGSGLTRALGTVMQLVGGADSLSVAIQTIAMAAIPAATALGILGVALLTTATAASAAWAALGPVGWIILGVGAAIAAFAGAKTYTTAQSINETRRLAQEQHSATMQYLKDKDEELRVLRETEEKKAAEENRSLQERAAVIRRDYFKALDGLRDKNKEIIESDRQAMQSMIGSQERVVAAYRNAANAALKIVQESQSRRVTLENEYSDLLFKKWIDKDVGFADNQKARLILQRSWALEAQANEAIAKAQTEDDVRRAQAISQRAEAYLKEGTALAIR